MRYFIIAGERSGDLHASRLITALRQQDNSAEVYAWGGNMMQEAGVQLLQHYKEISFMGLWEVISNLNVISAKLKLCKEQVKELKPDVLILVDFPGFNLRMAEYGKSIGLNTAYYISPKIWAWKKGRIKKIKKYVDLMLVILPFEERFYADLGYAVKYVGNPLVESIAEYEYDQALLKELKNPGKLNVAVLPGSRHQEVVKAITVIQELAELRPETMFRVAGVDNLPREIYRKIEHLENVSVYFDQTYELLKAAEVAIVTSGTATLEAAIIGTRQVVVYKTSWLTYTIGRMLINVQYISLVNLIAGKKVVEELIQSDYNARAISKQLDALINDKNEIRRLEKDYQMIHEKLGQKKAAKNAASEIMLLAEKGR